MGANWQPIETAPKDGTIVLLWFPDWRRMYAAEFDGGNWQTGVWDSKRRQPTHWMPLPQPPQVEKE